MSGNIHDDSEQLHTNHQVVVIGGGIGGICTGVKLLEAGISDFIILEQSPALGGTWHDNVYPGCACDVPFALYSFSFAPPSAELAAELFPSQTKIQAYLAQVAERHNLQSHFRFEQRVRSATWQETRGQWSIEYCQVCDHDGETQKTTTTTVLADFVVCSTGQLNIPKYPAFYHEYMAKQKLLPQQSSSPIIVHSARYARDQLDYCQGKTVAIVGNAASGVQLVQALQPTAKKVYVYQRSPKWYLPSPLLRKLHAILTKIGWNKLSRVAWFLLAEFLGGVVMGSYANPWLQRAITYLDADHYHDNTNTIPQYRIGCNRLVINNTYTQALRASNVVVMKDPIKGINDEGFLRTKTGHVADDVDVMILATGFDACGAAPTFTIKGSNDVVLADQWRVRHNSTLLGIATENMPNWFFTWGPHTNTTSGSIIFFTECAVNYIVQALQYCLLQTKKMQQRPPHENNVRVVLQVKSEATQTYFNTLQRLYVGRPELDSCSSWYKPQSSQFPTKNKNIPPLFLPTSTNFPGTMMRYWWYTRRFSPMDFTMKIFSSAEATPCTSDK